MSGGCAVHVFSKTGQWERKICHDFNCPRGIDIIDNYLFVSDCANNVIKKIILSSDSVQSQSMDSSLKTPYGLAAAGKIETLFICDENNSRIVATDFDFNVKYVLSDGLPGPTDVAYYNEKLYVADRRRQTQGQIVVLEAKKDGAVIDRFNSTCGGEVEFKTVRGIHVSRKGNIFVADEGQNLVVVMDEMKNLITTVGKNILYQPTAVTVKDDNVYVSSNAGKNSPAAVYVFSLNNNYETKMILL